MDAYLWHLHGNNVIKRNPKWSRNPASREWSVGYLENIVELNSKTSSASGKSGMMKILEFNGNACSTKWNGPCCLLTCDL